MNEVIPEGNYKKIIWLRLLTVIFILTIVLGCDSYQVTVYPNKENLTKHITIEGLDNLDSCRDAARRIIFENDYSNPDYECGINCRKQNDAYGEIYICEETTR